MKTVTTSSVSEKRTLRMSDPRLPLVASQAAIEFDNATLGQRVDFRSAKQLAGFLRGSFEQPAGSAAGRMNLDVGTVGIVGRALDESAWKGRIKTVNEVVERACEIVDDIDKMSADTNKTSFEQLRSFCVAFGNGLLAYRESLRESRPVSPYRR